MKNNWYRSRSLFVQPTPSKPPRKKWRIRHVIFTAIKRTCMVIGAFVLLSSLISLIISGIIMGEIEAPSLPDEMVLTMPLEEDLAEHENALSPYSVTGRYQTIRKIAGAVDYAAGDARVKGLVFKLEGGGLNMAHMEELRDAVLRFRAAGKFAYIYAPSYETLTQYQFASAFDEIWLQPVGIVSITGMAVEMPYIRQALDKLGIAPQVFARKDYKSLFESLTSQEMSPKTREMMGAILQDFAERAIDQIAAGRDLPPQQVQALIDKGLFTAEQALADGLVDKLDYSDNFARYLKERVKGDPESEEKLFAPMYGYVKEIAKTRSPVPVGDVNVGAVGGKKPKVALVYAVGQLVMHDSHGSASLSAGDKLAQYIMQAAGDTDIDVIVLRVDSPGGSPVAAEAVRRAVVRAKEKGKKVIVSMGASAASGGYWLSANADYIFAAPSTLTGSIGVTGGKLSLQEMWGKINVNWDGVSWGENATLWSYNHPYTPAEAARMNALMDDIYNGFVSRVAEGRGMSPAQVDEIAGGRVWTGNQAKAIGLVDELGGLTETLDYAAGLLGRKGRHDVQVVLLPRPKTAFEQIADLLQGQVMAAGVLSRHQDTLARLDNFFSQMDNMPRGVNALAPEWVPVK